MSEPEREQVIPSDPDSASDPAGESALAALSYEAPFLIEKLVKERIVDTPEEGEALFTEVKRYIVLDWVDKTTRWEMYSRRVDEVWHQFVLFTNEYVQFCRRFFGRYIHHAPGNAPKPSTAAHPSSTSSFPGFQEHYHRFFGMPLPDVWFDAKSITMNRRLLNDFAGNLAVELDGEMVTLAAPNGGLLLSVSRIAHQALDFVAHTGAFYVREMPGDLTAEEKAGLAEALVAENLLRVAP